MARLSYRFINKISVFSTKKAIFSPKHLTGKDIQIYLPVLINYKQLKNKTMNKAELIDAIAAESGLSKADAKKALDGFVSATANALKGGDRISLVGFGSFSLSNRAARTGRNPQTGKEIKIAAKNVVRFKAGAELSGKVN
jgi:DNA-binding protein HU-beta